MWIYSTVQKSRLTSDFFSLARKTGHCSNEQILTLLLSSFLKFFKDTLHTIVRYVTFSANISLGITLLVQKDYFMSVKLWYL